VSKAKDLDCISVVMNNRGIEADMLTLTVNSYSNDDDIELVVQHIKNSYPEHRVFAIGLSLGMHLV
jgi:predicted alpha/beta-fold hydrolase